MNSFGQLTALALLASAMTFAVSCGTGANKKQADTPDPGVMEVQPVETSPTGEHESKQTASAETMREIANPQEKIDWLSGDFKLELEEVPQGVLLSVFGSPTANTAPARKVAIKSGDQLFYSTTEDGSLKEIVFRREDDKVASYLVARAARKALRVESNWSSLEAILRSELGGSVWSEPKDTAKLTKTGSETIAGIECEVYEMSMKPEGDNADAAAAFTALAGMLGGGKGSEIKNPLADTDGLATMWIDPTRRKFVARRHIRMKMNGRETDLMTHNVLFFEAGGAHAHEIPDLSTYTIE